MKYYLWALFLILNPFYLFPPGKPQIGDFLMVTIFLISIPILRLGFKSFNINKNAILGFLAYSFLLNIIVGLLNNALLFAFVLESFFIYNFLVFFFLLGLAKNDTKKFLLFTKVGIFLSVTIQVGYLFAFGSANFDDLRPTLFFANPNQLGYYGMLMLSIFVVLNKIERIKVIYFVLIFLSCMLVALLSASKAAIGGSLFLLVYYLYDAKLFSVRGIITVTLIAGVSYWYVFKNEQGLTKALYVMERVDEGSKEHGVTEWQYRGYDRITNHPGYLVLGAGEGAYRRFESYIGKHEMHSSIGTLLFCYGIPGFILFGMFFASLFRGVPMRVVFYILPVVLYGLTHNGLRFTPLWVLLALFPIIGELLRQQKLQQNVKR